MIRLRTAENTRRPPGTSPGFTLIELLVVVGVIGILAGLLLPTVGRAKSNARRAQCTDNLRQTGLAARLYFDDHDDMTFRYLSGSTNGGRLYWFGWLKPGSEGQREFDPGTGVLHDYLDSAAPMLCPSLDYQTTIYKLKARAAASSYGYNLHLGQQSITLSRVPNPSGIVLFSDAAQINDFQAPASPENPLLEEFYYVDADQGFGYPNSHFRHHGRAQSAFLDGHVDLAPPVPGSIDTRLPRQEIGRLDPFLLRWQ